MCLVVLANPYISYRRQKLSEEEPSNIHAQGFSHISSLPAVHGVSSSLLKCFHL